MADIFSVSPPAWLVDLTKPSVSMGKILGELVGGMAIAAQQAKGDVEKAEAKGEEATWMGSWLKAVPRGIAETRMNVADPMWRIKAQQAELNMANTALQMQTQMQEIDVNKTKLRLTSEDLASVPKWLQEHPTVESRMDAEWPTAKTPEWNKNLDSLRLRDSQSVEAKVAISGVKSFADRLAVLSKTDTTAAAQIAGVSAQYTQRGQMPPPNVLESLAFAEEASQQRVANEQTRRQVEMEAAVRNAEKEGGTVQRTFGPKGESVTVKSGADTKAFMPEEVTLPSGTKMIRVGPRQFRFSPKSGEDIQFTAGQLQDMAEKMTVSTDKQIRTDGNKIISYLRDKALVQTGQTNAPSATTEPTKTAPVAVIGSGTETDPAKPATQQQFDSIPSGSYFLNPSDGKLYRKK